MKKKILNILQDEFYKEEVIITNNLNEVREKELNIANLKYHISTIKNLSTPEKFNAYISTLKESEKETSKKADNFKDIKGLRSIYAARLKYIKMILKEVS